MYFFDSTFFCFIIPALILGIIAQSAVKSKFNKYSRVRTMQGLTGAQAARGHGRHRAGERCAPASGERAQRSPVANK